MENIIAKKAIQLETLAPQKVLAKLHAAALGPGDPRLPKIMVLTPRELRLPVGNFAWPFTLGKDFLEGSCPGSRG